MPVTREQSYAALASLHPAPIFLQCYQQEALPDMMELFFRPPVVFFISPEIQTQYTHDVLIPILDEGSFDTALLLHPHSGELFCYSIEWPQQALRSYANWQQYLADLMLRIAEIEEDDAEVVRLGKLIGFEDFDALFALLALNGEDYRAASAQFASQF